ncbi:unnamed protein product (macronuclear) [Paramecium tetraurelia]|uniref:Protein kinase domain-containing protein n=1 Tax=Paramecium tetraurelia TaxID=5888 RepID=A0DAC6_PARTE|nr:uncharacterized protein GSPATT00014900001 [Paramecium tetraurelia]CAK79993.1 unnamed protein product [Paramecium tetraurelia]|eukprot:XP_001447390.1 hypothetical protein (macronuclear) [Paramecium tetraurelia strain d4-2]
MRLRAISENKKPAGMRNMGRDLSTMKEMIAFWGKKDEPVKLPPINIIERSDFYEHKPYEIKFKIYQNCFAYNNLIHKEFELLYITSPDQMNDSFIEIEYKMFVSDCYFGRPTFTNTEFSTQIQYYVGQIDKTISCMYQIENMPEHLLSSSKSIRSMFYHYYFSSKHDGLPFIQVLKTPIVFREKKTLRFRTMNTSISEQSQNGLLTLVYITEQYVPLQNIYLKKQEKGRFSYDEKLHFALKIMQLVNAIERLGIAVLELNMESILITKGGQFKISTANLIPFIQVAAYKEVWSMYDDYEKVYTHLSLHKTIKPPEVKRREPIKDFRAVTRYNIGLIILQLYFDIPNIQYIDEQKMQSLLFQLIPKRQSGIDDDQIDKSNKSIQFEQTNPLGALILRFLSIDPVKRLEFSLIQLMQVEYDIENYDFTEDMQHFFSNYNAYYRPPSQSSHKSKQSNHFDQQNSFVSGDNNNISSFVKQLYQPTNNSQDDMPAIALKMPELTQRSRKKIGAPSYQSYVRSKNLIAEVHFNLYLYQNALDQWQYLLPDVEECFGDTSPECEYILERIWVLAQHLAQERVLEQISQRYVTIRKSNVRGVKEQLEVAHLLQDQARVKALIRPNEAVDLYHQSSKQFQMVKGKFNNQSAYNSMQIGLIYLKLMNIEKARSNLEFAVYIFTKMEKSSIVPFLIATTWQIDDEEVVKEPVNKIKFFQSLFHLGSFYFNFESQQKAYGVLQAAKDVMDELKKGELYPELLRLCKSEVITLHTELSKCLMSNNEVDDALKLVEEGIQQNTDQLEIKSLIDIKVEILVAQGKISDGLAILGLWARQFQRSNNLTMETAYLLKEVGDLAYKLKDFNVAFSFYSEALAIYQKGKVKGLKQKNEIQQYIQDIEENLQQIFQIQKM